MNIGDKVRYRGGETHQNHGATSGIYTLHSIDDLLMTGYVEIRDSRGRVYPVDAKVIEAVE